MKLQDIPSTMSGVLLTGHGGLDKLEYREDLPVSRPAADEVLIRVGASAVNNTDINIRIGWYSKSVSEATQAGSESGFDSVNPEDAAWSGSAISFPRIQGADCCGTIVETGANVDASRLGERVLVRPMYSPSDDAAPFQCETFGAERDGGFAEYTVMRASEVFPVRSSLSDAELASFPCAWSTAEGMLERAGVCAGEQVLITGASGGVGSAAVQLAKRRGAKVIALCSESKFSDVKALGADRVVPRGAPLLELLEKDSIQVVVDLVAGPQWPELLEVLCRGGCYVVSGAIAGPMVELDVRTLYLKDLSFFGATWQPKKVFENLIRYIEQGEIRPLVAKTYPLADIVRAQLSGWCQENTGSADLQAPG